DIAHPDLVSTGARDDEVAAAAGAGFLGGSAHRVPLALASLAPFGADARPRDAPGPRRLALARPVGKRALHPLEPLRLEPKVDRRPGLARDHGEAATQDQADRNQHAHGTALLRRSR